MAQGLGFKSAKVFARVTCIGGHMKVWWLQHAMEGVSLASRPAGITALDMFSRIPTVDIMNPAGPP